MPDRLRTPTPPRTDPLTASVRIVEQVQRRDQQLFQNESWQDEAWGFFDSLGEFNFGITWLSQALSRVRLTAAEQVPGGDEPEPLTDGPAAELMEQLGGGIGGRAALMRSLGVQIGVPGEGWLIADRPNTSVPLALADWSVKSTAEVREYRGKADAKFEVRTGENEWRPLVGDSLVARIWEPHRRFSWRADSSARSAIPIMREIDLYNRRIIATMVSRLAMNGVLLIPQEGTISVPEQYQDSPDPFVQMLIEIASNNIKNPGGASASIPIPIRFQSELIEKWKHLTFGDGVDEPLLKARDSAIGRLATTLNMPAEVLKGVGEVNHWTGWLVSEEGIKLHISPPAETIANGLTVGYLHPLLQDTGNDIVGPNGGKIVVWYDPSELTARPDKSQQALQAYDRVELSGAALRRESGLDEGDAPTPEETRLQILKKLATMPATALDALAKIMGEPTQAPVAGAPQPSGPGGDTGGQPPAEPAAAPATGQPDTRDNPPPPPGPPLQSTVAAVLSGRADLTRTPVGVVNGRRGPPVNGARHSRDGPRQRRK
jgi:hypothetical protein